MCIKKGDQKLMNKIYVGIGKMMRRVRNDLGLTQEHVGKAVSIEPAYYGQLERATKVPSLQTLIKIADVLKVSPKTLLAEEKDDSEFVYQNIKGLMKSLSPKKKKFAANVLRDIANHLKKAR